MGFREIIRLYVFATLLLLAGCWLKYEDSLVPDWTDPRLAESARERSKLGAQDIRQRTAEAERQH